MTRPSKFDLHIVPGRRGPQPSFDGHALSGDAMGAPFGVFTAWEGGTERPDRAAAIFFSDLASIDLAIDALLDTRRQLAEHLGVVTPEAAR